MTTLRHSRAMLALSIGTAVGAASIASLSVAQQAPPPPSPELIAAMSYSQNCATCHGPALQGGVYSALKGDGFLANWGGASAADLLAYVKTNMPPANVGGLDDATYAAIVEHILRMNSADIAAPLAGQGADELAKIEIPQDSRGLSAEREAELVALAAEDAGFGASARWPIPPAPERVDRFATYTPVTADMLAHPADENWLTWRRSHYGLGFSPLTQIDRGNVGKLRLAWSVALPQGENMNEPLVRDGVLYVHGFGDEVWAMDAADGAVLWRYQRGEMPRGTAVSSKKTLAMWGDVILTSTSDLHVVALDARTGAVRWDSEITDKPGFRNPGGPLAADGVVMQALTGQAAGSNTITGFDIATGQKLWTFNIVAQEGQPGGDSWNGLSNEERSGGSSWTSGTYDPETGVALFGSGATYDTGPLRHRKPGMNNDALYTDATMALEPRTGKLRWYYQHMKNDQLDLDWVFDRVVGHLIVDGQRRRVVITSGKEGLFDVVDAEDGTYVKTVDMGLQDFVTAINPKTGEKLLDESKIPDGSETVFVCPHGGGGRNWGATAFNEETSRLFVVARDICMDLRPVAGTGFLSTGVAVDYAPRPGSDGKYGVLQALDMQTGKIAWDLRQRAPFDTSILATAGGVLFAGSVDRKIRAWDQANGQELWSAGLPGIPNGGPISFAVDGRQYVAFLTGYGNPLSSGIISLTPDLPMPLVNSSAIYVFALPD